METNQVSEHLQVIRTLMERSALYRRELAPVMLSTGTLGVAAAAIGLELHLESMGAFAGLWLCTAAVAVAGAFLIVDAGYFGANLLTMNRSGRRPPAAWPTRCCRRSWRECAWG